MKRLDLDKESSAVKRFVAALPIGAEGVELQLNGKPLCKVVPVAAMNDTEKAEVVRKRWRLIERAQQRNKGVPAKEIEREVLNAVEEVRERT